MSESKKPSGYDVIDSGGKKCPNLVGVFGRTFPIVAHEADYGHKGSVSYYGESYRLVPR